ncbi:unnamed protein product [Arabidopsis arenosa]|uniref:Uncharacterized protein n=1 Tax=Arabidopsis arenosa TaxID=38785 RepID=A0A8S2B1P7_ARAAE|nr:unnamed protein product [Arabidopsis arenosa]
MGNCQAAEAATVLIHHPAENKVERIYWSVTASDVMKSNPGHYVAVVVTSPTMKNEKGSPLKQLKLLRPDDTLLIGHVYRLVSFEEVLNEFATKKCVKLGKLLKEGGGLDLTKKTKKHRKKKLDQETGRVNPDPNQDGANDAVTGENGGDGFMRRSHGGGRDVRLKQPVKSQLTQMISVERVLRQCTRPETQKKSMGDYRLLRNSGVVVGIILLHFAFVSFVSSDELQFVVGETGEIQVTPSLEVKGSPGLKPDRIVLCERIHIHGLRRFKHIDKYAHSLKLVVNASTAGKTSSIDVCFHRNLSRAIGMCPHSRWEKASKGSWVQTMSPFDHKILDVRVASSNKVTLELSAVEELFMYRIVFLILGAVLLVSASTLSQSLAFYYSSAMAVGIILVVLLVLFQGMKLLPTGRSSFALFIYSSLLGLGGFLLRYIPGLFQSLLTEMGIDEEMYTPVCSDFCGGVFIFGWSIFRSSVDPLLAGGALISVILMSSTLKKITRLKFLLRLYEIPLNLLLGIWEAIRDADIPSVPGYLHDFMRKSPDASEFRNRVTFASPSGGVNNGMRESPPSESDTFPSSFHKTPERSQLTKEEWKKLTKDSTTKAVQELVSSPDFGKWAAVNADRISVTPRKGSSSTNRPRKWLRWF